MSDLRQRFIDAGLLRPARNVDGLRPVQLPPGMVVFRIHDRDLLFQRWLDRKTFDDTDLNDPRGAN